MKILGFHDSEFVHLIEALVGETTDVDAARELFARATWTGIAEPGDRAAGVLVAAVGAQRALAWLEAGAALDGAGALIGSGALAEQAADAGLSAADLQAARDRWLPRLTPPAALLALRQAARFGVRLLAPGDAAWPTQLDDLGDHTPLALWVRGTERAVASLSTSYR